MSSVAKMIARIEDQMDVETEEKQGDIANPEHLRMVEALLFAASEPLDAKSLSTSLPATAAASSACCRPCARSSASR